MFLRNDIIKIKDCYNILNRGHPPRLPIKQKRRRIIMEYIGRHIAYILNIFHGLTLDIIDIIYRVK